MVGRHFDRHLAQAWPDPLESEKSMKYLLWLGVIAVVWWIWSKRQAADQAGPVQKPAPKAEKMVRCAHCGVYLPASESLVADGGEAYCCPAHRDAGPAAGGR